MRLFVTGGAGHTGIRFLQMFLSGDPDRTVVILLRRTSRWEPLPQELESRICRVYGDLEDDNLWQVMQGCDAAMHIAHQTLCPVVIEAVRRAGISRVFFVTTAGVFSLHNDLADSYRKIETRIRESGLSWTVFRPTMIYGSERDVNMHKLLQYLDKHSIFPIFGDGRGLMQPVHVDDLARGLVQAIEQTEITALQEYNLSGRSPNTYNEIVKMAAKCLGKQVRLVHLPYSLSLLMISALERFSPLNLPVKSEQIRRLSEDKACSWANARNNFGYEPRPFAVGIAQEASRLRDLGLVSAAPTHDGGCQK